jgi:hypothetical protein
MHAIVTTPAEPPDPCHSSAITLAALADPMAAAFPITSVGRLPRQLFRGLLDVHSRYGLHTHRVAKRPFPPRASAVWLPTRPSRLLRGVMTTSPTGLSPAGLQRPFTAHDVNSFPGTSLCHLALRSFSFAFFAPSRATNFSKSTTSCRPHPRAPAAGGRWRRGHGGGEPKGDVSSSVL